MTARPLHYSFRLCAGALAAGAAMPEVAIAQTTRTVPTNYSCYNVNAVAIDNWNTVDLAAFSQATQNVGGQTLRVPGGDTANYWNWESNYVDSTGSNFNAGYGQDGGIVNWYDYIDNGAVVRRPGIFPFFLPQNLPDSLRYQDNTNATIENVESFVSGANADALWVLNMNTSYLEKELAHLERATTVGLTPTKIELGNELYFRGTFGSLEEPGLGSGDYARRSLGDGSEPRNQVAGFPNGEDIGGTIYGTPTDYAEAAKAWADAARAITPNAEISVTGVIPGSSTDPRITGWMDALAVPLGADGRSALDAVDAITIHPYYSSADIGITSSDIGNNARAGQIARDGIATFRNLMSDPAINTPQLANKKIWITEQNIIEPNNNVVVGNTWLGALMVDMHNHEALKDTRVDLSCTHVLTGNAQWQAIADEEGKVIDPNKRGTADATTDGTVTSPHAQPFSQTATGFVLGKSADVFQNGTATLLHSGEASVAWRVEDEEAGTDVISALNAGDEDESFLLPEGEIWEVLTYIGDPWATIDGDEDLEVLLEILVGGSELTIPAFSKLIATADPNAPRPEAPAGTPQAPGEDAGEGTAEEGEGTEGEVPVAEGEAADGEDQEVVLGPAPVNGSLAAFISEAGEDLDVIESGGDETIDEAPVVEAPVEESPAAEEPVAEEPVAEEPVEDSVPEPIVPAPPSSNPGSDLGSDPGSAPIDEPINEPTNEPTNEPIDEPNPSTDDQGAVESPVTPVVLPPVANPLSPIAQAPQDAESVPEPGSMFGLGLAGAALMLSRRQRRQRQAQDTPLATPHFSGKK
ncbi:MAG: PEP-CTERM sorting domain-containing protein [Phormidesmis sp.]